MKIDLQKRLAADILGIGQSRIWLDPSNAEEISKAITKHDVKALIKQGIIRVKQKQGVSRGRAKMLKLQRSKGRRKGHGRRKGTANARTNKKQKWIHLVRPLRVIIKTMKQSGKITSQDYRDLYLKIKGNFFRNSAHLKTYAEKFKRE